MASKHYSAKQKEKIRLKLLTVGLDMYSQNGIKAVRLGDILTEVDISKPFFYKFYTSVAEFIVEVLYFQWERITQIIKEVQSNPHWTSKQKTRILLNRLIHFNKYGLLVMTQEEQVWVRKHLDEEKYQLFLKEQILPVKEIMGLWGIEEKDCCAEVLSNMVFSMLVTYNSAKRALPFLYLDKLEETAEAQAEAIILYIEYLKNNK